MADQLYRGFWEDIINLDMAPAPDLRAFLFMSAFSATQPSITLATSAAADDIVDTATAHGFVAGDAIEFATLTGGAGLAALTRYFVIAASLGAQTFKVALTRGGAAIDFTTDITAGTVRKLPASAVNLDDVTLDEFDGVGYARIDAANASVYYSDGKVYIDFDDGSWGDPVAPGSGAPTGLGLYRYVDGTAANDILWATITTGSFVNANNGAYNLVLPTDGLLFGQQEP